MAETPSPTPEQQALRRRARRRLVGAIALALLAVVVLPMVFDPEPKRMANNVDIRIPDQNAPLAAVANMAAAPKPEAAPIPAPAVDASVSAPAMPMPEAKPTVVPAKAPSTVPAPEHPADKKPALESPKAKPKPQPKLQPENKAKPVAKPAPTVAPKVPADSAVPADKPYFLQLGVFSSEENAKHLVAQAQSAGFKAAVVAAGGQFKVRIGPVGDRAKALDYQAKLKSKGLASVLVEP
jgi:DedD protein